MKINIRQILVNLFPLVLFSLISIIYFGLPSINHFNSSYIGGSADSQQVVWSFAWWKYSIQHHLTPFFTKSVWFPYNYNLAQQPILVWGNIILAFPLIYLFGPVIAYNISMLAAPALAGWTAFFLLRYISKSYWPAIIGAYFFCFSCYMIGHMGGHLMLATVFLIPIMVLLTIQFYKQEISNLKFCFLITICLALQCYIDCEIFATLVFFGCISLLLAIFVDCDFKKIKRMILFIGLSLMLTLVLILPFLFLFFHSPQLNFNLIPSGYENDLASAIIPPLQLLISNKITLDFFSDFAEISIYVGVPVLVICCLYFIEFWNDKITKFLMILTVFIYICALGTPLHIFGHSLFWMPWQLFSYLPLIKSALAIRFGLYFSLLVAIIIAQWITKSQINRRIKYPFVILSIIFLLPSFQSWPLSQSTNVPQLISQHVYKKWLKPNDVVVILPYAYKGNAMLWQFKSNFYFAMAGGYLGYTPQEFSSNPTVQAFLQYSNLPNLNLASQPNLVWNTENFLLDHKVKAIFVYDNKPTWKLFFNKLGLPPINVDGVDLYLTKFLNIPSFEINFLNWSGFENDAQNYWIWCSGNSKIYIHARKNGLLTLSCQINAIKIPRTIYISLNNKHIDTLRLNNTATGHFKIAFQAKKNTNYSLHFYSPQKPIQPIPNSRWLSFAIMNYKVKLLPSRSIIS